MNVSELGEFKLIDELTSGFTVKKPGTVEAIGDDCAVIEMDEDRCMLIANDLLLEGVHFDPTYFPLKHLGYKSVVAAFSDICAMNGTPTRLLTGLGLSSRYNVEDAQALYEGIRAACQEYDIELIGGDITASKNGLLLSITAIGEAKKNLITYRRGAKKNDLICVTGDLGAAYLGLCLLNREKRVLTGNDVSQPQFDGYQYPIQRQLMPFLRIDMVREFQQSGIQPTAMIDLSKGLASELKNICKASGTGARIYLDRLPIASKSFNLAEELKIDPVVAALNGGEDYELLFTVPASLYEEIVKIAGVDVIGHMTDATAGIALTTPDGSEIEVQAQGWR